MGQITSSPFRPIAGSTVSIAATSVSANVAIPAIALTATAVRIVFTAGTAGSGVRVRSGGSGVAAVAGDPMIPNPGSPWAYREVIGIGASDTFIAAKADTGTATVEFTFGFGS